MKTDPDEYLRQVEEDDRASWLDHEAEEIAREEELKRLQAPGDLEKSPGSEGAEIASPPKSPA